MDAALDLIAERGEEGVTLRELTEAAGANVGGELPLRIAEIARDAAVEQALGALPGRPARGGGALDPASTLEELAVAFARPMMRALTAGGRDLAVMRIVARGGIDPPPGWNRFDQGSIGFVPIPSGAQGKHSRSQGPRAEPPHALRGRNVELAGPRARRGRARNKSEKQIERLLVPALAGAFRGTSPG